MSKPPLPASPYDQVIDAASIVHVEYFADAHGLTFPVAADLIRGCHGDRRAADEAAIAFRSHFAQSLDGAYPHAD
ncbi:hypothetical protein [Rhizobium tubonense]|uniref:Uncharacterized protein n=1 Tax=Rhizobium tubonense TaxID=484088 RepID=A0A2W4CTK5_9HYPH|nr:hypothetical protein [Rhizobium tubonense]PZM15729.1 hypothetical protein CPY51_06060 [Rhizobium tubonense]